MRVHQVTMLGSGGVGKSAVTVQMVMQKVVDSYDPTIEDSYRTNILRIDDESCLIEILDTAGQEQYTSLTEMYVRNGEAFMLVYSLTDYSSFLEIKDLHQQITIIKDSTAVPLVLIGNKSDLAQDREVETSEGAALAQAWNCPFFETSAKKNVNIREAFHAIVRQCRLHEQPEASGASVAAGPLQSRRRGRRRGRGRCTIL